MLASEINAAGWDPFDPSDECVELTRRPVMCGDLDAVDIVGIHWVVVSVELKRKFRMAGMEELTRLAVLFALRDCQLETELTPDVAELALASVCEWHDGRLRAAFERIREVGLDDALERQTEYQPALAYLAAIHDRDWTDFEGNRREAAWAILAGEARGYRGGLRKAKELRAQAGSTKLEDELSDADVARLLALMTTADPGQKLFFVTSDGRFRLGMREGRGAFERNVGRIQGVHQRYRDSDFEASTLAGWAAAGQSPSEAFEIEEQLSELRAWRQERRGQVEDGSIDAELLDAFVELADPSSGTSIRRLAEETGLPRNKLGLRYQALKDELVRHLS